MVFHNRIVFAFVLVMALSNIGVAQVCYNNLFIRYDANLMEQVGEFRGEYAGAGMTNRILIIDRDNLNVANPVKLCGEEQTNSQFQNLCTSVDGLDRKFIFMHVIETFGINRCTSEDFAFVDIIDTKFDFVRLPNFGGIEITNSSEGFTPPQITVGQNRFIQPPVLTDGTLTYDFFPEFINGIRVPVYLYGDYFTTYEFQVTNSTTQETTYYPSYIGHKFILPNGDYTVELILGGMNSQRQVTTIERSRLPKTIVKKACSSFTLYNTSYNKSGVYQIIRKNPSGCDSIITLDLTIVAPNVTNISATTCNPSYVHNGITYTTPGTFTQALKNKSGCDSTLKLTLKFLSPTSSIVNATSCGTYVLNGQTYPSSGTYTQVRKNKAGCDSTITLNLTIPVINNQVVSTGTSLTATETSATYKWFDCASPSTLLANSAASTYTPLASGQYGVTINKKGCSVTSACITYNSPLVSDARADMLVASIHPNPTAGFVTIKFDRIVTQSTIFIINAIGSVVSKLEANHSASVILDISEQPAGLYRIYMMGTSSSHQSYSIIKE